MPCHDPYAEADSHRKLIEKHNKLTRMLCEVCAKIDAAATPGIFHFKEFVSPELHDWWEQHKKADAELRFREDEKKYRQELRAKTLSKLTHEEKDVLGIIP